MNQQRRSRRRHGRGKRTHRCVAPRHGRGQRLIARITLLCFLTSPLQALAEDTALGPATTVAGEGEFTVNDATLTEYTQSSERAIVEWGRDIDQPADHTLAFRQAEGYAVLNRGPGLTVTQFRGSLVCDATCIFVNPLGVHFHEGSTIDVGQLIAAAGNISNDDFMRDNYIFSELRGEVENRGTMRGDSIGLFGARVANFGNISVPDGALWMLAGDEVVMREHGSPVLVLSTLPPAEPTGEELDPSERFAGPPAVENAGQITAGRGSVRLAAGDLLSFAIRQSGSIQAAEISLEGGDEGLVEVSGTLDASDRGAGESGGHIEVLGDYVAIEEGALLDASGSAGGGSILVGGDEQGQGELRRSRATYVHPDAQIRADAIDAGDGGKVVVWSDGDTHVYGAISAHGGEQSGSGGFVETSGKHYLDVTGTPDLRARSGREGDHGGEWLLDPNNIEVVGGCDASAPCLDDALTPDRRINPLFRDIKPSQDNSEISADVIVDALEAGISVTLTTKTSGDTPGTQDGNITVSGAITVKEAEISKRGTVAVLRLQAANDIKIDNDITVERSGSDPETPSDLNLNIILLARDTTQPQNDPASEDAPSNFFVGDVNINAALETGGGSVTVAGANVVVADSAAIATDGGDISIASTGGDVDIAATLDTSTAVVSAADATAEPVGGRINILAEALRRGETSQDDSETKVFGGDIRIDAALQSGGGQIGLSAHGGNVVVLKTIDSAGGEVDLRADSGTFSAEDEDDITQGGTITLAATGKIASDGGGIDIGRQELISDTTFLNTAKKIDILGEIDSRDTSDPSQAGGAVVLQTTGADSHVVIQQESGYENAAIRTGGGSFSSTGAGSFHLEGEIDATPESSMSPDDVASEIHIEHAGDVTLGQPLKAETYLKASEKVRVKAGSDGTGTLSLAGDSGQIGISADEIVLEAGDGYSGPSSDPVDTAHIELGNVVFSDYALYDHDTDSSTPDVPNTEAEATVNPSTFTLRQDASLAAADIPDPTTHFKEGNVTGMTYTLAASDGDLTIDDSSRVVGSALTLQAARNLTLDGLAPGSFESLDIEIAEDFTVSGTLASTLYNATDELSITAGGLGNSSSGNLTVQGSLLAKDRLELRAGAGGNGDLRFEDEAGGVVGVYSDDITLRAGGGGTTAKVDVSGANFRDETLTEAPTAFTLRQDASIDGDTIPDRIQLGLPDISVPPDDANDPIDITLRSDGGSITIDETAADALYDTDLALHASTDIDIGDADPASPRLNVRTLDLGGLGNFTVDEGVIDNINFTIDTASRLVLRAGLDREGNLGFSESGLEMSADEIRLVAGDGVGGDGVGAGAAEGTSSVLLTPALAGATRPVFKGRSQAAIKTFVFRQDADIELADLPSQTELSSEAPGTYVIRSDDGKVSLGPDDTVANDKGAFAATSLNLPKASEELILWANTVSLVRGDEENLDLTSDFGLGTNDTMEIRASVVALQATSDSETATKTPKVLPGSLVTLTDFADDPPSGQSATSEPLLLDLTAAAPTQAPDVISIIQDGDIESADLIDVGQLGYSGSGSDGVGFTAGTTVYELRSKKGNITVAAEKVNNSELLLILDGDDANDNRNIAFASSSYALSSLAASDRGSWRVAGPGGVDPLTITARDEIVLEAAQDNVGDLTFGTGVTLRSNSIILRAGANLSTGATAGEDLTEAPLVDAQTNDPRFVLQNSTDDPTRETLFEISQHGSLVDVDNDDESISKSVTPTASQFDTNEAELDWYVLTSQLGSIELANTDTTLRINTSESEAQNVWLSAGQFNSSSTGKIKLEDTADLDLTLFKSLATWSDEVELVAKGDGVVKAEGANIRFFGPDSTSQEASSPSKLTVVQENAPFKEITDSGSKKPDCSEGCLPDASQLGNFPLDVDYTIEATNNTITLDRFIAEKVWGSALTLLANGSVAGEPDITISATKDRAPGAFDLVLDSLTLGSETKRVDILFDAKEGTDLNLKIATTEDQTYYGKVEINGSLETSGATLHFLDTVEKAEKDSQAEPVQAELVANTSGRVIFDGNVGGSVLDGPKSLDLLQVNFDPQATLGGTPGVEFGEATDSVTATRIEFAARALEFLNQSGAQEGSMLPRTPLVSTLYKKSGDLTFTADEFVMGQGEKLSVVGDVAIVADTRATIGDISALNISVEAGIIEIQRRPGGSYLELDGTVRRDGGVDYVANTIDFDGDEILLSGSGHRPTFALEDSFHPPSALDRFTVTAIRADHSALRPSDFEWDVSQALPDLHPSGPSRDDLSTLVPNADLVPSPGPWLPDRWLPPDEQLLADLEILPRPTRPSEYRGRLDGATIIDDIGSDRPLRGGDRIEIARERLMGKDAVQAVALHDKLFGADGTRATHVKAVLQAILDHYLRNTGARRVVGFELRRYIKNRPSSWHEAYQTIEDLDRLFAYHRRLGLTPGEYRPIQLGWLRRIQPEGISLDELSEAIHPSRYVRGSDVLDIFGE